MAENLTFDTTLAEKAITTAANGDLLVEGFAATWELDREGWAYERGSFAEAAKAFMERGSQPLLAQHRPELGQLGRVEALEERPQGLWMRARIPKPADSSPLADWYAKVAAGMTRGLSIKGRSLIRKLRDGTYAARMRDLVEISVTPAAINVGGVLAVAQKAVEANEVTVEVEPAGELSEAEATDLRGHLQLRLDESRERLDALEAEVADAEKAVSAKQRANAKFKMKDGSFPINHCGKGPMGVGAALSDLGRTNKDRATVLAHIRRAAKALGCADRYPALSGKSDGD